MVVNVTTIQFHYQVVTILGSDVHFKLVTFTKELGFYVQDVTVHWDPGNFFSDYLLYITKQNGNVPRIVVVCEMVLFSIKASYIVCYITLLYV